MTADRPEKALGALEPAILLGRQQADIDDFLASDRAALIPAVGTGAVAAIVGEENVAAISPTALTLPWILPDIVEQLAAAAAASAAQG